MLKSAALHRRVNVFGGLQGDRSRDWLHGQHVGYDAVMTEAEWLACSDPRQMQEFVKGKASDRKLRLFACACCRRVWTLLTDERSREAVEAMEQYADGRLDREECWAMMRHARRAENDFRRVALEARGKWEMSTAERYLLPARRWAAHAVYAASQFAAAAGMAAEAASSSVRLAVHPAAKVLGGGRRSSVKRERDAQADALRDIFGNPFRPVTLNPSCFIPFVVSLAQTIYDERTFDRMPELANELEGAGCDNVDVLSHCRDGSEHVRGCWVLDLVLGKS